MDFINGVLGLPEAALAQFPATRSPETLASSRFVWDFQFAQYCGGRSAMTKKMRGIRKLPALDVPSCKNEGLADHEVTNGPWDWSPGLCNLRYFRAGACPKLPGARRGPQRAENQPKTWGRAHKGTRKRIAPKPRLRASGGSAHAACVQARFRRAVLACAFACALVCLTPCVQISGPSKPTAGPVIS